MKSRGWDAYIEETLYRLETAWLLGLHGYLDPCHQERNPLHDALDSFCLRERNQETIMDRETYQPFLSDLQEYGNEYLTFDEL